MAGIGRDRQGETDEAVATELQRDRCQHDGAARRRLDVGIGQPRVHRPHRHLHGERHEERQEHHHLRRHGDGQLLPVGDREAATACTVEIQQRDQHQERTEQRVEEEFHRSVDAVGAAPDADNEEHRDQRRLEEHVEQQRVGRGEHAVHQAGHHEERRHVLRDALLDHAPAGEHDDDGREAVQQDQQQRDAVDAEAVVHVVARDPDARLDELHPGERHVEVHRERQRHDEAGDGSQESDGACKTRIAIGAGGEDERTDEDRDPDGERQKWHGTHRGVTSERTRGSGG